MDTLQYGQHIPAESCIREAGIATVLYSAADVTALHSSQRYTFSHMRSDTTASFCAPLASEMPQFFALVVISRSEKQHLSARIVQEAHVPHSTLPPVTCRGVDLFAAADCVGDSSAESSYGTKSTFAAHNTHTSEPSRCVMEAPLLCWLWDDSHCVAVCTRERSGVAAGSVLGSDERW